MSSPDSAQYKGDNVSTTYQNQCRYYWSQIKAVNVTMSNGVIRLIVTNESLVRHNSTSIQGCCNVKQEKSFHGGTGN